MFNVVEFPATDGRTYERKGVATGRFRQLFEDLSSSSDKKDIFVCLLIHFLNRLLIFKINRQSIYLKQLSIYLRTNLGFRMPENVETPVILIGPGTGVAPFLGFLAHREELVKRNPSLQFGSIWLLYGCRNKDQDYLYK